MNLKWIEGLIGRIEMVHNKVHEIVSESCFSTSAYKRINHHTVKMTSITKSSVCWLTNKTLSVYRNFITHNTEDETESDELTISIHNFQQPSL